MNEQKIIIEEDLCPECETKVFGWLNYPGGCFCKKCGYKGPRNGWERCPQQGSYRHDPYYSGCCIAGYVKEGMKLRWKRTWTPR